ncbi:NAD+ synthase [Halomarina halobia]|uniref:NH(3)-dependent NAD(+) synthetase n=1 Tax=Halomarina halobia TaxID=3033386 RepID=A0ABD6ADC6_9EURY|nr:NAD+ synthase [Halomarina sp. PSR21]
MDIEYTDVEWDEYDNRVGRAFDGFLTASDDLETVRAEAVAFIGETVAAAGADGVVVAMSGGVDSTLTAALAVEAVGGENVLGLALPYKKTDGRHTNEARTMAEGLGIEFRAVSLRPVLDRFEDLIAPAIDPDGDVRTIGNVIARLRMLCAYYAANAGNRLVLGTSNRSELLLGYFTKHGDGAADLYPIGDLYKREVRALADRVGLPQRLLYKEPTAGLWTGQTDRDELGAPYDAIDPILHSLVERDRGIDETAERLGADRRTVEGIARRCVETWHKRSPMPTPGRGER